ncbi:ABC transporter substrate-binding protein [Methylobacterium sp. C25]|uniref:MlaC/ttg2D family ABC transporter substrate-binding protein n=1 Tax=Methylobacterium sp. C25 TaxID=2721622 RepID=UPI001F361DFE|nr:ABC transporter substrate-binding protein [Methylobacterium sp. C25]MCE4225416.1 ABC transporter substrate-binding protein [Methylobacterium sp. C25]
MRLTRRSLSSLALLAALVLAGAPQRARAEDDPAVAAVTKLYGKVEEALKSGSSDLKSRIDVIGPTFKDVFDTGAMVPVAVGPKWKTFKPEQQSAVTDTFTTYFTTLYANRLSQAAGGKFDIKPGTDTRGGNKIVHTKITTKDGDDTDVDYVVNASNKIQDVLLNGNVSEVASMRAGFNDPVKKGGADALVKYLNERTEGMLAAKPKP